MATVKEVAEMLRKPKGRVRNVASKADRTYNGHVYHSKAEALWAFQLDCQKQAGIIRSWRAQPKFTIWWPVGNAKICDMILDFEVQSLDNTFKLQEIKGWETPEWKLKKKLLMACYPDLKLEVIRA